MLFHSGTKPFALHKYCIYLFVSNEVKKVLIHRRKVKFLDVMPMPGFQRSVERPAVKVFGAKTQQPKAETSEKIRLEFVSADDAEGTYDGPTEKRDVDVEEAATLAKRPKPNKSYGRRERPVARFGSKVQAPTVQENISNFFKRLPSFVPKSKQVSNL